MTRQDLLEHVCFHWTANFIEEFTRPQLNWNFITINLTDKDCPCCQAITMEHLGLSYLKRKSIIVRSKLVVSEGEPGKKNDQELQMQCTLVSSCAMIDYCRDDDYHRYYSCCC